MLTLVTALLSAFTTLQEPSLLPAAPAGWRTEHLTFPLGFAPELDYRGFEDLVFAPGMFAPDSDSYFSYALGIRLEGAVVVDERMLRHFLETYYRGLCGAVAADRKLERDVNAVRARVTATKSGFQATVEMFDPFTDGRELELALELRVHDRPRATEILGLASPLDREARIWKELDALGKQWSAARPAPVFLNHIFVVVDAETYAALAGCTFLRESFAVSEERTTVRADQTYTGLYFYGQRTYFEFLKPGSYAGTGLALGVEREGALSEFARNLTNEKVRSQGGPLTRKLGADELAWFEILGLEMPTSVLTVFAMEYDPIFLARWHAEKPPAAGGIGRAEVLERYAAALERTLDRTRTPLLDLSSVELVLDEAERERLTRIARAARWELTPEGVIAAPQARIHVQPAPSGSPGRGITAFEVELRHAVEREPLTLGKLAVRFEKQRATFTIQP
jgi:hypothetical protein